MGVRFSSALEYPLRPDLAFLSDSSLIFSELPQDICKYVLTPYLLSGSSRQPVYQRWRTPLLVSCFTASLDNLTILQNGDMLYVNKADQWNRVSPTNRHPPLVIYDENTDLLPSGKTLDPFYIYDYKSDTLYMNEDSGTLHYKIVGFCHIHTLDEFLAALTPCEAWVREEEKLVSWASDYQGLVVKREDEVVFSHPFPVTGDQSCNELLYYGGYLIINTILDCRHDNTNVVQVYRMLE